MKFNNSEFFMLSINSYQGLKVQQLTEVLRSLQVGLGFYRQVQAFESNVPHSSELLVNLFFSQNFIARQLWKFFGQVHSDGSGDLRSQNVIGIKKFKYLEKICSAYNFKMTMVEFSALSPSVRIVCNSITLDKIMSYFLIVVDIIWCCPKLTHKQIF